MIPTCPDKQRLLDDSYLTRSVLHLYCEISGPNALSSGIRTQYLTAVAGICNHFLQLNRPLPGRLWDLSLSLMCFQRGADVPAGCCMLLLPAMSCIQSHTSPPNKSRDVRPPAIGGWCSKMPSKCASAIQQNHNRITQQSVWSLLPIGFSRERERDRDSFGLYTNTSPKNHSIKVDA